MQAAPDQPLERGGLWYPHGDFVPADGALAEVWPGILWLRMPLPFSLNHINLWVLDGGDHWVIVDTGVATPEIKGYWRAAFDGPLKAKPVGRIIVTHYHPDHIGLAGWLARKWGVSIEATRAEYMLARVLTLDVRDAPPPEVVDFYASHGWPEAAVARLRASGWGNFARAVHPLPSGYKRLRAGDSFAIGGRRWEIVVGSGHSPEHACLYCADEKLLISGDQVLPRITSNVSVYPTEPDADPLGDWLDSLAHLRRLDSETRVFPAHNAPFLGLHTRLDQLDADHRGKLDALLLACATPTSAYDSFPVLFRRGVAEREIQMATGEALAHLLWLHRRGVVRRINTEGQTRFQSGA